MVDAFNGFAGSASIIAFLKSITFATALLPIKPGRLLNGFPCSIEVIWLAFKVINPLPTTGSVSLISPILPPEPNVTVVEYLLSRVFPTPNTDPGPPP